MGGPPDGGGSIRGRPQQHATTRRTKEDTPICGAICRIECEPARRVLRRRYLPHGFAPSSVEGLRHLDGGGSDTWSGAHASFDVGWVAAEEGYPEASLLELFGGAVVRDVAIAKRLARSPRWLGATTSGR